MILFDENLKPSSGLNYFLGFGLALVILTKLRVLDVIGLGEIVLGIFGLVGFIIFIVNKKIELSDLNRSYSHKIILYYIFVLVPITIVSVSFDSLGSNLRDLVPYFLSFSLLLYLCFFRVEISEIANGFLLTFICLQFFIIFLIPDLGRYTDNDNLVSESFFINRFTGGANNPNQLAFYCLASLYLIQKTTFTLLSKSLLFISISIIGSLTLSDAYFLSVAVLIFIYLLARLNPSQTLKLTFIVYIVLLFILILSFFDSWIDAFYEIFSLTNDGSGSPDSVRIFLYLEGIKLWFSNIFYLLFGQGAGAFIELNPLKTYEAHNTYIDFLLIFGLVGTLIFLIPPLKSLITYYQESRNFLFATVMAILVFCLFHYVGRQPLFWFLLFALISDTKKRVKLN